jgi:HD-GYP domain-containing protein (c-di-GMP phosphodiesterase class II)
MNTPTVLLIGVEEEIKILIEDILNQVNIVEIPLDTKQIRNLDKTLEPCLILSKTPGKSNDFKSEEIIQLLRIQFKDTPSYLYFKNKDGFNKDLLSNNGFTEVFLLPTDLFHMRSCITEILSIASLGSIRFYRSVKLIDIYAGDILNFDTSLYLPVNRKFIRLSNAGESLDNEKIERIKNHHFNSVHVTIDQLGQFYAYTAQRLKNIPNSNLSITEKKEKLMHAVRELMTDLFNDKVATFESGQEILKDCSAIVKSYILQDSTSDWYLRIEQVLGQNGDDYSHAGNTSTLAALFSIGLGIGNPEDLALAGLLHDIGITELPYNIQNTTPDKMTPIEFEEYKKHPDLTVNLIKSRKIVVSESVIKIIQQHHELYNGDGYPQGLFGDRIMKESQILAIADRFDELTSARGEHDKPLKPIEAVQKLTEEQMKNPAKIKYNPELLKNILSLFPQPNKPTISQNPA